MELKTFTEWLRIVEHSNKSEIIEHAVEAPVSITTPWGNDHWLLKYLHEQNKSLFKEIYSEELN